MTLRLCLASQSPRRAELLRQAGYVFEVCQPKVDETIQTDESPAEMVRRLSLLKARTARDLSRDTTGVSWVFLGADTTVVLDREVMEKPEDQAHARQMLSRLSGRTHQVVTAVSVISESFEASSVVVSAVTFRPLADRMIQDYCASGEPLDKAGAYAIQGRAGLFVERLEGSYSGVVGLPLCETAELLDRAGIVPAWRAEHANS